MVRRATWAEVPVPQGLRSSAPEMDQVLADLRRHLSEPETLTISYAMIQVTGRVPGP